MHMHARWVGFAQAGMLRISAIWVVTLLANFPTHAVPHGKQIFQFGRKNFFGITPNTDLAFAFVNAGCLRTGFTDEVAVFG